MAAKKKPNRQPKSVTVVKTDFKPNSDKPFYPVSGGFGGLSPTGDSILLTLYTEVFPMPLSGELKNVDGFIDPQSETYKRPDHSFERVPQCTISLTARAARSLAIWLNDRADQLNQSMIEQMKDQLNSKN